MSRHRSGYEADGDGRPILSYVTESLEGKAACISRACGIPVHEFLLRQLHRVLVVHTFDGVVALPRRCTMLHSLRPGLFVTRELGSSHRHKMPATNLKGRRE